MASPATAPQSPLSFRPASDVGHTRVHRLIARRLRAALDVGRVAAAAVAGKGDPLRGSRYRPHPPPPPGRPDDRGRAPRPASAGGALPVGPDSRTPPRRRVP